LQEGEEKDLKIILTAMPEQVVYWVTNWGYLAIFLLVFFQEIGLPNPFPNELLLMFSGYLSFKGLLYLPFIVVAAVAADFIGTNILYFLFYSAGTIIMNKKPGWLPLSSKMIERLKAKISGGGLLNIYIFRLTPFTRGYISVIAGLLQLKPKIFLPIALITAITWASVWVAMGNLIGPSWNLFIGNIEDFKYYLLAILAIVAGIILIISYFRKKEKSKGKVSIHNS
jgi:membrane protein DedA with SNARE-associated domain